MTDGAHPPTGPAPLVSVLLPVHNGGAFLAEALDSVPSQTLGDLE
jgi:glycosyltransferase involved in cell wall biosynthesis